MFSKIIFAQAIALTVFLSTSSADIVIRDTTDSAVADAAFVAFTDNFLASTPSFQIQSQPFARTITEIAVVTARSSATANYDNFRFVFGEVLDVDSYRAEEFAAAFATGSAYPFVNQATAALNPSAINSIVVQGQQAEELVFSNLSIYASAGSSIDLVFGGLQVIPNNDAFGVVLSSGNTFLDRYDTEPQLGGLIPNLEFPLSQAQYAVRVSAVTVPEPSALFIGLGFAMVALTKRTRSYSQW